MLDLQRLGIDDRQHAAARLPARRPLDKLSANVQAAARKGRRARRGGGELDLAGLAQLAVRAHAHLMQHAVHRDHVDRGSVRVRNDRRAHTGAQIQALAHARALLGVDRVHKAGVVAHHQQRADGRGARPVVPGVRVLRLPLDRARLDVDAHQVAAVRVTPIRRRRAKVHAPVLDDEGAQRLLLAALLICRELRRDPHRGECIGRERLKASPGERHDDHAVRIHHARDRVDGGRQGALANGLARCGVDLQQLGPRGDVDVRTHVDWVGDVGGPIGRVLDRGYPGLLHLARGSRGLGIRPAGIARPRALPLGSRRVRIGHDGQRLGQIFLKGGIRPRHRVACLEHHAAGAQLGRRAVDEQLPVLSGRLVPAERIARVGRGDGVEVPAVAARSVVGLKTRLLEQELGRRRSGRAIFDSQAGV